MQFQQPAKSFGIIQGYTEVTPAPEGGSIEGQSDHRGPVAAYYEFDREEYDEVVLAAGASFVSREKAEENLWAELSDSDREYRGADKGTEGRQGRQEKESNSSAEASLGAVLMSVFDMERVVSRVTQQWESTLSAVLVSDDPQVRIISISIISISISSSSSSSSISISISICNALSPPHTDCNMPCISFLSFCLLLLCCSERILIPHRTPPACASSTQRCGTLSCCRVWLLIMMEPTCLLGEGQK